MAVAVVADELQESVAIHQVELRVLAETVEILVAGIQFAADVLDFVYILHHPFSQLPSKFSPLRSTCSQAKQVPDETAVEAAAVCEAEKEAAAEEAP